MQAVIQTLNVSDKKRLCWLAHQQPTTTVKLINLTIVIHERLMFYRERETE